MPSCVVRVVFSRTIRSGVPSVPSVPSVWLRPSAFCATELIKLAELWQARSRYITIRLASTTYTQQAVRYYRYIFFRQKTARIIQQAVLYKIYSIGGLAQDILKRRSGTNFPNRKAGWYNK